ncbi:uncharacterized protein AKAW2_60205A [Aspergillus luchuensis]|uniref:L-ornithine N(5)-monooxygenase n=1 Tax=Aspergillus kawachii TaxID=1069201 RepID=A0A7R7WFR1_ASPKA|nr:uncharacterized protein AKAW2_60205A [Aspergillus luchuensis]BCS01941.1 hypothetical protein AKAW2_60205A [Aspergillus luchuensis]BCS13634.1 hypothetical protein ALUC_60190A [Aspergillus luchuensis]
MTNSEFVDRQTKEGENDESMLHVQADALIVATGNSQVPNGVPSQLAGFKDRIVHSSAYDESFMQEVADKKLRVLIVGGGESSADISADLCDQSPNLTVWLRRPPCAAMRYLNRLDETQQIKANQTVDFPTCEFSLPDGTKQRREFDIILLCHSFRTEFSWLHLPDGIPFSANPRSRFLHCFPEGLGDCLFFLGYARPGKGGIPSAAEMPESIYRIVAAW